ncbi:hypothetical protein [Oryzibacter oryziterrae]|jgi:hypothetical protein|uniref:hypothetical protein n=1 Tax=Oryzibacter oryziterrae TaxID=2766474 RepID=UPI001F212C43|nr:hypothetical protein [Oryzibacter oryziterrae]
MHIVPIVELTPAQKAAQRRRSIAIGLGLGALVVLFFLVTIVKISGNIAQHAAM